VVDHLVAGEALDFVVSAVPDVQVLGSIVLLITEFVTVQALRIRHASIRIYLLIVAQPLATELCCNKAAVVDLDLTVLQNLRRNIMTIPALRIDHMGGSSIGS